MQANHLKSETETYEEKEQQLVNDCVKELSKSSFSFHFYLSLSLLFCWAHLGFALTETNSYFISVPFYHILYFTVHPILSVMSGLSSLQISAIAEELARKTEDASRQQEEITHLLSQIVDLQKKAKSVSTHPYV